MIGFHLKNVIHIILDAILYLEYIESAKFPNLSACVLTRNMYNMYATYHASKFNLEIHFNNNVLVRIAIF